MEISKVSYSILLEARCYKCFVIFSPFLSPGSPPVKRITIRAFAGVAMLFHLPFFLFFFFYYFVTIRSLGNGTTKFPPRVLISRIHESESRVKIRKRAITRVTLSMISIVAPVVFHGIYSAIRV